MYNDLRLDQRAQNSGQFENQLSNRGFGVGALEYPRGLRELPDLQHYVAFIVNVREKSKFGQDAKNNGGINTRIPTNVRAGGGLRTTTRLETEDAKRGLDFVTNNAGTLAGFASFLTDTARGKPVSGAVRGAAVGVGTAAAVGAGRQILERTGTTLFDAGTTSRLKDVITLHLEERPSVKYTANYSNADLGVLTGSLIEGSAAGVTRGRQFLGEGFARAIAEVLKLPALGSGSRSSLADLRELATATKTNPFRQTLFESIDYRTFNFKYRFFPKDQDESKTVFEIIKMFKKHMHPEISANKLFYIYPSEFEIVYMFKNTENNYFNKIGTCALTDMQVDYGGEQFATFQDGSPVEINMSLTFREVELLDSQGYDTERHSLTGENLYG